MPFTSDRYRSPAIAKHDAAGGGARSMPDDPDLSTSEDDGWGGNPPFEGSAPPFTAEDGGDDGPDGLQATPDMGKRNGKRKPKKSTSAPSEYTPGGAKKEIPRQYPGGVRSPDVAAPAGDASVSPDTASSAWRKAASPARDLIVNGEKIMTQLTPGGLQKRMSWGTQNRGSGPLPGQAQDSPGNTTGPAPGAGRHPQTGQYTSLSSLLAMGHQAPATQMGQRLQYHTVAPTPLATITTVEPQHGMGPLASSICDHQGQAVVQSLNQATASQPYHMTQLGRNAPSGNPSRPPFSGGNQPTPAQPLTPPSVFPSPACKNAVPGSQYTTRIPSNGD